MSVSNNTKYLLMAFGAALALAGCGGGADQIVSPGLPANPPPAAPPPPPAPPPAPPVGETASCPAGTVNQGTFASGAWRACRLPSEILGDLTLRKIAGVAYQIQGSVAVGRDQLGDKNVSDATKRGRLYIEPGVTLFGQEGPDALLVQRGSQLFALGTKAEPITFTSRQALNGNPGKYNWGGVVLMGRAPINNCIGAATPGAADCQGAVEGTSNFYGGGNDPTDNSGEMTHTRILYSGYAVFPGNELQGLTLVGVGNGTKIEYLQSHMSGDDGIEIFGGTVNLKHIVISEHDDDGLDTDWGWSGGAQFGLIVRKSTASAKPAEAGAGFEWSSLNKQPFSTPKVSNFTMINSAYDNDPMVKVNQSTQASIYNSVFLTTTTTAQNTKLADVCFLVDNNHVASLVLLSNYFTCARRDGNAWTTPIIDGANKAGTVFGASTLNTTTFLNGASENAVATTPVSGIKTGAFGTYAGINFFVNTTKIGAEDATGAWWTGWTVGL